MQLADPVLPEFWYPQWSDQQDCMAASLRMSAILRKIESVKPFPQAAHKLIQMLSDPQIDLQRASNIIEEDPGFASQVLRLSNSALFGGLSACKTVAQAVVRLGTRSLKELIYSASIAGLFRDVMGVGSSIRDHLTTSAAIVRFLAQELDVEDFELYYICGLMHDVGKLLLLQMGDEDYGILLENQEQKRTGRAHEAERSLLGFDHAVLGGHVMLQWKIPYPIPQVVAWHHTPERTASKPALARIVNMIRLVDLIIPQLIQGDLQFDETMRYQAQKVEIDESFLSQRFARMQAISEQVSQLMSSLP